MKKNTHITQNYSKKIYITQKKNDDSAFTQFVQDVTKHL